MSGTRLYNFREGDRSEYLATYLLSGLGLINPVPRQEDIGVDFHCQLADQEKGVLSFGNPFIIQIKSSSTKSILYGNLEQDKWDLKQIEWLFKQNQPFFIGSVDKETMKISIYDCSTLYHLRFLPKTPTFIEFTFEDNNEVYRPEKEIINTWSRKDSDGYKHIIKLGLPLITIDNSDLQNKDVLKIKKDILRQAVEINQYNVIHIHKNIGWINYISKIDTNEKFTLAWDSLIATNDKIIDNLINTLDFPILNLAMNLYANGEYEKLKSIRWIIDNLKILPEDFEERMKEL